MLQGKWGWQSEHGVPPWSRGGMGTKPSTCLITVRSYLAANHQAPGRELRKLGNPPSLCCTPPVAWGQIQKPRSLWASDSQLLGLWFSTGASLFLDAEGRAAKPQVLNSLSFLLIKLSSLSDIPTSTTVPHGFLSTRLCGMVSSGTMTCDCLMHLDPYHTSVSNNRGPWW